MEKPSFNQIQDQYNSGHKEATVLVPERGKVRVATTWGEKTGEGRTLVTYGSGDDMKFMHAKNEDLADERQAELAEQLGATRAESTIIPETDQSKPMSADMGEVALHTTGVEQPAPEEPEEAKDDELKILEMRYQAALDDKAQAQRMGNGEGSIQFGQMAGGYLKQINEYKRQHGIK